MAAYADSDDLIARKSVETIADLASDDGDPLPHNELSTNPKIVAALEGASGEVEAACLAGNRYSTADLAALTGNSQAYLLDIVCDLAMARLFYRKASSRPEEYKAAIELADIHIERLRKGERVFDVQETKDAGNPSYVAPSVTSIQSLNLIRDRMRNYYPARVANS